MARACVFPVRILDHDTYSAHNAIGKVYISLSSVVGGVAQAEGASQSCSSMDGWFPIFDMLHGNGAWSVV